jgi:hypothetical protein
MIKEVINGSYGSQAICVCDYCGKKYRKKYSDVNHNKNQFCGNICFVKYKSKKLNTSCAYCGEKIFKKPCQILKSKNSFCNSKCQYAYMKGEKNPNFGKGLFGSENGRWVDAQSPENIAKRRNDPKNRIRYRITIAIDRGIKNKRNSKTIAGVFYPGYILDLMAHLESKFKDGMSWQNMGQWHIDHIIPVSLWEFETYTDREFKQCWSLCNLQPLWALDNLKKYNKVA